MFCIKFVFKCFKKRDTAFKLYKAGSAKLKEELNICEIVKLLRFVKMQRKQTSLRPIEEMRLESPVVFDNDSLKRRPTILNDRIDAKEQE